MIFFSITGVEVFGLIFVRSSVNAVKFCKKCGDCGECGENKYFSAFHRISYIDSPQNSPHFLQKFTAFLTLIHRKILSAFHRIHRWTRWMRWKKNNSPHFTAFLTKIHRQIHRISYKNSPHRLLWQNNVRNAVNAVNAVKKKIIHHISPHFLQKFTAKFTAFLTKIHRIWFPKFTQSDLISQEIPKLLVKRGAGD